MTGAAADPVVEVGDLVAARPDDGFSASLPDLKLTAGQVAALLGPSGCGKTSLLLGMLGLLPEPQWQVRGHWRLAGREFPLHEAGKARPRLRNELAVVLQDAPSALDPLVRIGAQIQAATGATAAECRAALQDLGLEDAAAICRRYPHQVSGGQAQRVLLAVALLRAPPLLLLDEPSASLDGGSLDDLLRNLTLLRQRTGTAMLLATHDRRLVEALQAAPLSWREPGEGEAAAFLPGEADAGSWPRLVPPEAVDPGEVVLAGKGLCLARRGRTVFAGVDLELRAGESVALVGESGAGKTSLARILVGHETADAGAVQRPPGPAVQLLFQDALGSLTPGRTVGSLLAETAAPDFDAAALAQELGLAPDCLERTADRLSGGERRRVALLRALSVRPRALILDEPTAALDRPSAVAVAELLCEWQRRRRLALLWITHDPDLARAVAHRVLLLQGGRLCALPS